MGEPAKDFEPPFPNPFDFELAWPCPGWPLHKRSRSELSKEVVDDVAESAAIFCRACRRILRETLRDTISIGSLSVDQAELTYP